MQSLEEFELEVAKLGLIRLTERPGERVHAICKTFSVHACNIGEAYYSLRLRMSEFKNKLDKAHMFLPGLAECLELVHKGPQQML